MEKRNQTWEGMTRERDRNVNFMTGSCLKIFLVSFYLWSTTLGYKMKIAYGVIKSRCEFLIAISSP